MEGRFYYNLRASEVAKRESPREMWGVKLAHTYYII